MGDHAERRSPSPCGERCSDLTGLPIVSTEPLSAAERRQLDCLARLLRTGGELIEAAIVVGRVDNALQALQSLDVGALVAQVARGLGSKR